MALRLTTRLRHHRDVLTGLPAMLWLLVFFFLPLASVFGISFLTRGTGGRPELPFTLANYERVFFTFGGIFTQSINTALITTIVCLLIGYPMAYVISTRKSAFVRGMLLFLVILPFWTNFLVRTYALRILLGLEGPVNGTLLYWGMVSEPIAFLNTRFAVIFGLVYGFLPFMVLPIYAAIERFNFRLVEASADLGANEWQSLWHIVLPLTMPGVIAGCALVFIPAIGAFVTPDLLGGVDGLMIGNLIQRQYSGTGNLPLGAAFSNIMLGAVLIALLIYSWLVNQKGRATWLMGLSGNR